MSYTVLVAEDDNNIRQTVEEYFKASNYQVLSFEDGTGAMAAIEDTVAVDVFLLDIMLPGFSGLELLKKIRGQGNTAPVIMLTALDDEYTQLISFNGLADDYVTKPFSPKLLVKRVEAILRRTGKQEEVLSIGFGDLVLDCEAYVVFEQGETVNLTLKEIEILKQLILHKGKVLSRQQLLNLVWGYEYFGDERVVDVHIKNLRKKLNTAYITTVKGVGYKIEESGCGHV